MRLDIDPGAQPDIVSSIVDMAAVAPMSVDAVWSSHNIEHVYAHEVAMVLAEFHRVLRVGGVALVATPDLQAAAKVIATGRLEVPVYFSESGPIAPLDIVFGHGGSVASGNEFMAHRTGFTAQTLTVKLRDAGFDEVSVMREKGDYSLLATARRLV